MRNIFLGMFVLSNFVASIFAGEINKKQVEILVRVNPGAMELHYANEDSIDKCHKFNIAAQYNSPCFIGCNYRSLNISDPDEIASSLSIVKDMVSCDKWAEISPNDVEDIKQKIQNDPKMIEMNKILKDLNNHYSSRAIPWQCFVNSNDNFRYKSVGDVLFSFNRNIEKEDITFMVILETIFKDRNPQDDIDLFRKKALCPLGYERELCEKGIMRKVGQDYGFDDYKQQYEHWLNSYFGDEIKAEQKTLFIKKLLCCGSLAVAILMYVLYQKFYTTAC